MVACFGIEQACHESAAAAKDLKWKTAWREFAQQESKMAGELEVVIGRLGGDPRHGGLAGASRFFWTSDRATAAAETSPRPVSGSPHEEVQREAYRSALQAELPVHVHMLVQRQNVEISVIRQRMRRLEQAEGKVNAKLSRIVPRATTMWFDF
jgi:uncharacterized protein (TIGR02284 family)